MSETKTPDGVVHAPPLADCRLSVNERAAPLVELLVDDARAYGVQVRTDDTGVRIVDAGIDVAGSVQAGLLVAEICMGGFGTAQARTDGRDGWPTWLDGESAQPVLACLGSQYAGWSLSATKEETGGKKFFSLGSGPARALSRKEALYAELGYVDESDAGVLVMEVDRVPPPVVIEKVLRDCKLKPEGLTIVLTPTSSPAGTTQVVGRVLEVALHQAHERKFDLSCIVSGQASAPLPSPSPDGVEAMGRTNDAILYGGRVHLTVRGSDDEARRLARALPSRNSRDYGRCFADIFKAVEYDFYKIDPALFAPAEVWVSNIDSGNTWHGGALDMPVLLSAWLKDAA